MRIGACQLVLSLCAASATHAEATLLDAGYRHMYNLRFSEAHAIFAEWERQHPEDPMGPASDADKATEMAAAAPEEPNARFAAVLCHGLESDYLALIEKRYLAAFREMKIARGLAERLLAENPEYYDAWIAIGVENYMLGLKPAPLRWLLKLGGGLTDRALGLEKLRVTAQKGRYLQPFARLLLAVAALRDHQTQRARELLAGLTREFPDNPLYSRELARLERS